jgi:hypothetical protein
MRRRATGGCVTSKEKPRRLSAQQPDRRLSSLLCRDSSRHFFADARHSAALFVTPAVFAAGSLFSRDKKQITGGETAGVTAPTPHSQLRMRVPSRDPEGAVVAGE